jgi:hypothetical protein
MMNMRTTRIVANILSPKLSGLALCINNTMLLSQKANVKLAILVKTMLSNQGEQVCDAQTQVFMKRFKLQLTLMLICGNVLFISNTNQGENIMTKQMLITFTLILIAVVVTSSEAQQFHFANALIGASVVLGLTAVFFRQQQVFARRPVRVTK